MTDAAREHEIEAHPVREQYSEYVTEEGVLAVITDPENRRAWISSCVTCDVET